MKQFCALFLAAALMFALPACQKSDVERTPGPEPTETAASEPPLLELGAKDWEAEMYSCTVPGTETDYEEIARQLTEQYAQVLRARPQNMRQSVLDAQPMRLDEVVYDAYYGEEDPNFCFDLSLYLDLAEERVMDWMVGTELGEPSGSGTYPTYWGWSREAMAEKGEDGNWHLTQLNTGDTFARLPVCFGHLGDHPGVEEMMNAWFLTKGDAHDWRILQFLDAEGHAVSEVKAEIDKRPEGERQALLEDVRAYMAECDGSYTWKAEDWA